MVERGLRLLVQQLRGTTPALQIRRQGSEERRREPDVSCLEASSSTVSHETVIIFAYRTHLTPILDES